MTGQRSDGKSSGEGQAERELLELSLAEVAGPVIVLDPKLRVVAYTESAEVLVGSAIPRGVPVVKVLCGEAEQRPLAEAMAEGRPVSAQVSRPTQSGPDRLVSVRAVPLGSDDEVAGWLLLLTEDRQVALEANGFQDFHGLWTRDPGMRRLIRDVIKVARSRSNVLVRGETGSGKELVARGVHLESPRSAGPFRALNCAALPAQLLESELFGHVRGAFTGAVRDYEGHVRLADGGTLFLDEVAELPLELQAKLLRVLQDRTVLPVGAREAIPVDVRFVAATHQSLRAEVKAGRFRADLMYRLRVVPLFLPPLRERLGDISLLAQRFVESWNNDSERVITQIAPGTLEALESYSWPGNVRELQNAIEYGFVMGDGPVLTVAELPPEIVGEEPASASVASVPAHVDPDLPPEAVRILHALERAAGSRERAASSLGISRVTLWRRLRQYGLLDS